MNKADIIIAISEELKERNVSKKEVDEIVSLFFDEVVKALSKGEEVKISSFGSFRVKTRKERVGTSPVDGKKISIPASKTIGFKPSKNLKEEIK